MSYADPPMLATWRAAVASKCGPKSAVTRLVLLTLATHMDELGEKPYPSLELLAVESGLALRTVKAHMAIATGAGWIVQVKRREPNGQGWRQVDYTPKIPTAIGARFHVKQRGAPDGRQRAGEQLGGA